MTDPQLPLTEEEKLWAFRCATNSMDGAKERWAKRINTGLTDEQLAEALQYELGILGGSSGAAVGITFQGAGLRLWADRCVGSRSHKPILEGQQTVSFARRVYGIKDPDEKQMGLF